MTALKKKAEAFCSSPSEEGRQRVQQQWKAAMKGWQAASVISFGPVTMGSMAWKFEFWPDQKNLIKKRVEAVVSAAKSWSPAEIGQLHVAARGMGAVE
ncbi:MAG: hypothetical protein MI919_04050, partial [Holophagales bacterium]|nr:hypothetical protein [Holophagales bacterium]